MDNDSRDNLKDWMKQALEEHESRISEVKEREATISA